MTAVGTFLLTSGQLWRNMAETGFLLACEFRESKMPVSVQIVGGPSEKLAAANCQNRYPSPSKRSGPFPAGPLLLLTIWQIAAETSRNAKKLFANMGFGGDDGAINKNWEGKRACRKFRGSLRLPRLRDWQPAETPLWNKALWVPAPVQAQQLLQVAMSEPVRSSGQPGMWHIARPIRRAAGKNLNTRPRAQGNSKPSGVFPGGFFTRARGRHQGSRHV